ncbi:uncharacterized protein LOC119168408 isoform X1 [Rhipicephalus microplus]|uniref:uncharacterized protein LOC119168408 isoform X1 n=1 Tax=Rhipicephalus microplus TaxID=6941 RepID=UPI003F6A89D5
MLRHGPGRLAHGEEGRIVLVFEVADDSEQKKSEDSAPFSWSEATQSFCCYPLKVFVPREAGRPCCRWVYPIVFGGGLVSGDAVHIDVTAATRTCVLLTSQSYPKVYQSKPGEWSVQRCTYNVQDGALLCVLPDITTCFADASFEQTQVAHLSVGANIVLLDWYLAGRVENGERWALARLASAINVYVEKELVLREAVDMASIAGLSIQQSMGVYDVTGVCLLLGPYVAPLVAGICSRLESREQYGMKPSRSFVAACSPLRSDNGKLSGCVMRFMCLSSQQAYSKLEELLGPLFFVLGGNPFALKY